MERINNNKKYLLLIKQLQDSLLSSIKNDTLTTTKIRILQDKLDNLATIYPPEKLSEGAYHMFFLQAQLHYYEGNDQAAQEFLDDAIQDRGQSWPSANTLQERIDKKQSNTHSTTKIALEPHHKTQKIDGWLLVLVIWIVLLMLSCAYLLITEATDLPGVSQLTDISAAGYFEITILATTIILGITVIRRIYNNKKSSKSLFATMSAIYTTGITAVYCSFFNLYQSYGLDTARLVQYYTPYILSGIGLCAIWIPYIYKSKRAKDTLVN